MTWVYWQSEPGLWTVGYYAPDGHRHPESDHASSEEAAQRVHWLNGGQAPPDPDAKAAQDELDVAAEQDALEEEQDD